MPSAVMGGGDPGTDTSKAGRVVYSSALQSTVIVTSTAGDVSLPDIVVPANPIPTGTSIQRVRLACQWRKSIESSTSGNAVNVAQAIQVRDDSPSSWLDAITIPDNSLAHAASASEGGYLINGAEELSSIVDGADTYEFQWENADVDGDSLTFYDWQNHLIIEYA